MSWQDKSTGSLLKANTSLVSPLQLAGFSVTRNHQNGTGYLSHEGQYIFFLHGKSFSFGYYIPQQKYIVVFIYECFFVYYCCHTVLLFEVQLIHTHIYKVQPRRDGLGWAVHSKRAPTI